MKKIKFKFKDHKFTGEVLEATDHYDWYQPDGSVVKCVLDTLDWQCNLAPIGFIWVRRLGDISPLPKIVMTKNPEDMQPGEEPQWMPNPLYKEILGPKEVVGMVHIITKEFYTKVDVDKNNYHGVRTDLELSAVYHAICVPPPILTRVKNWFKSKFRKESK